MSRGLFSLSRIALETQRGNVKAFTSKGYGFVTLDNGTEVFVHSTDIICTGFRTLAPGMRVMGELVTDEKNQQRLKKIRNLDDSPIATNFMEVPAKTANNKA